MTTDGGNKGASRPRGWRCEQGRNRRHPQRPPLRGRPVEGWETAELLEPYGEYAGLASMYLLSGYSRGLLPLGSVRAA